MIAQSEEGAGTDWTSNIGDQRERERDVSDPSLQSVQGRQQTCHNVTYNCPTALYNIESREIPVA